MTDTKDLMVPTVHLNGTSGEELLNQIIEVRRALHESLDAMQEAAPHGRDYYIQGAGLHAVAVRLHLSRVERIQSVLVEMDYVGEQIADQIAARVRR